MKRRLNFYLLCTFFFLGLLASCKNKPFHDAGQYSDKIWGIIPEKEKEIFNHLSDEDASSTYTLLDNKWGEAIRTDPDAAPDESLLNSATSAKYLSINDYSKFKKTHIMATLYAGYYIKQYNKTGKQEYLDKILVIAYHLRQNRNFPPASISELSTLISYLKTLLTISENDLKIKGYKKPEINELYENSRKYYSKQIS